MKILYLHLHNFTHIYSGLGVRDVELDFRDNTKVINVIIGKMGSCKTVILGHLQPFATFGTIDSRNQDGVVIPGENGTKEIIIRDQDHEYFIFHSYTWTSGHHILKSFIKEDDTELNPSGSTRNFKLLVESKLGLDQNMMTLLRLGPNVTNMIDMSAASRKNFMASLLQDTEIYTMLYKKLNDDLRTMNAKASVLTNRLTKVSKGNIEHIRAELRDTQDQIQLREDENRELQEKLNSMNVFMQASTGGMTVSEFTKHIQEIESNKASKEKEIQSLDTSIRENQNKMQGKSYSDILVDLGAGREKISSNTEKIMQLDSQYKDALSRSESIMEKKLIRGSQDQIRLIEKQIADVQDRYDSMCQETANYSYRYDSSKLRRILGQVNQINLLIHDISLYNPESVKDLVQHGDRAINGARKKSEILSKLRTKLQRKLGMTETFKNFIPDTAVFFPPECPTHDCPYYTTHPVTIAEKMKGQSVDSETKKIREEIEEVENEIFRYEEYPIIASKINAMRILWNDSVPILEDIRAIRVDSMRDVFSSIGSQVWYDHDDLMRCIELSDKYETKNSLSLQLKDLQAQLESLKSSNSADLQREYEELKDQCAKISKQIEDLERANQKLQEDQDLWNRLLQVSIDTESLVEKRKQAQSEIEGLQDQLDSKKDIIEKVSAMRGKMEPLMITMGKNDTDLQVLRKTLDDLRLSVAEFESTSKDLQKIQEDQEILKYIVEAVSSSKGIPLVYIQLFLRSCKETLNDLISDVFGDSLEILDFIITQDEFKIPYSINGVGVDDIAKASQGQRSIISLALSFALIRQSMTKYNIILLDEMDGPLYRSDRTKFLDILYKQIAEIGAEQIFLVSHNNTFDGHSVNIIMTTEENVEDNGLITVMHITKNHKEE